MKQKKILATIAVASTICATHTTVSNHKNYDNKSKKVTNINEKLFAKNNSNSNSNETASDNLKEFKSSAKVVDNKSNVNIRNNPSNSSMIIGKVPTNSTVNVTHKNNDWYKVNFKGDNGYIHSSSLSLPKKQETTDAPKATSFAATTGETGTVTGLTSGVYLHVRDGASLDYNIIADLNEGDTVNIISKVGNWYEINYNGEIAYVYSSYVNVNSNSGNSSNNSSSSSTNSIPATSYTGTVTGLTSGVYLHVRNGAGLDYNIIADLNEGDSVNIISKVGNWYEINYNGEIAYVYSSYINVNSNSGNSSNNSSSSSIPATNYTGTVTGLTSGVYLHVRTGPSLDYNIISDLDEGASVNIIAKVGSWYEINYNGEIAYVYGSYVNVNSTNNESNNNTNTPKKQPIGKTIETGSVCNLPYGVELHVRSGAGLNYNIIGDLNSSDTVDIISKIGNWYKINYNGEIAYVYSYYVSLANNNNNNNSNNSSSSNNEPYNLNFGKNSTVISTNYPGTLQQYIDDQYNNWPYYSHSDYDKYINPASASNVYQFLTLNQFRNININELNNALQGDGILSGQGQAFYNAAKEYNIDPIYFVAQCLLETGRGSSYLANGVTINEIANPNAPIYSNGQLVGYQMIPLPQPVTVYNLFGIGAYNNTSAFPNRALILGTTYAYTHGWTSISSAIAGAADFLSSNYINNPNFNQITPYEIRFNPNLENLWHQYATTVWYGSSIGSLMQSMSYIYSPDDKFTFKVPTFNN